MRVNPFSSINSSVTLAPNSHPAPRNMVWYMLVIYNFISVFSSVSLNRQSVFLYSFSSFFFNLNLLFSPFSYLLNFTYVHMSLCLSVLCFYVCLYFSTNSLLSVHLFIFLIFSLSLCIRIQLHTFVQ